MTADRDERPGRASRPGRWVRRALPPTVILLAAGGLVAVWRLYPKADRGAPPEQRPPVPVQVETIVPVPEVADTFRLPAVVEANRVVDVAAEEPGRIERFAQRDGRPLREGDAVRTGEPILYLNQELLQAEFDRAKAQVTYDVSEYERVGELHRRAVATDNELDRARTQMAVSKAALEAAKARLDRTILLAPIDGVLDELPMEVGEYAQAGTCVARIVDVAKVKVAMDVPERVVGFLKVGDRHRVTVEVRGEPETRTGPIAYVAELADPATRTSRVEITLDNADGTLRTGQIVQARLTRRVLKDVIMIPLDAVIPLENGKAVYLANSDVAQERPVELGLIGGETVQRVQVVRGLKPGEKLILPPGNRLVAPGQRVAPGAAPETRPADPEAGP